MIGLALGIIFLIVPEFYDKAQKQDLFVQIKPLEEFELSYLPNGNSFDKRYLRLFVRFDSLTNYNKTFYIPDKEHEKIEIFMQQLGILKEDGIKNIVPISFSKDQLQKYGLVEVTYQNESIEKIKINSFYLKGKEITLIERVAYYALTVVFSIIGVICVWLVISYAKIHIQYYQKTGESLEITNVITAKIEGFKYVLRGFKSENKESSTKQES